MKVWHIKTWGAGTPHYLVSAETKKEAWLKVKMEWKKRFGSWRVGDQTVTRGYVHQTENDLKEIVGLTTRTSVIVDLNENMKWGAEKVFGNIATRV